MLQLRNITKTYRSKTGYQKLALDNISLDFSTGQMVFVVGKSGCGKSTLLNLIGGLDTYDGGEMIIEGVSTKDFSPEDYDYYRNKYIGFIFQEYNLLEEDNIRTNISLAQRLQRDTGGSERIESLLKDMGLEGYGDRLPAELSGGERQRAAIARALIKSPDIILADEPTGALDTESGVQILDILKEISKEKLVIVVSHDREYAEKYGDRIIELSDGKVISDTAKDTVADIVTDTVKTGVEKQYAQTSAPDSTQGKNAGTVIAAEQKSKTDGHKRKGAGFAGENASLPFAEACKIGLSGLKKRKLRLATAVFLAAVAIFLFGLCTTLFVYNRNKTILTSMYDTDISTVIVRKHVAVEREDGTAGGGSPANLSDSDIEFLRKKSGTATAASVLDIFVGSYSDYMARMEDKDDIFRIPVSSGGVEMDAALAKKFNYMLLAGRYPESDREIAVSEYIYYNFRHFGHLDPATGVVTEMKNFSDLLGLTYGIDLEKYLGVYTIVGVVDTGLDMDAYLGESPRLHTLDSDIRFYGHDYVYLNLGYFDRLAGMQGENGKTFIAGWNEVRIKVGDDIKKYAPSITKAGNTAPADLIGSAAIYWKSYTERRILTGDEIIVPMSLMLELYTKEGKNEQEIIDALTGGTLPQFTIEAYKEDLYTGKINIAGIYYDSASDITFPRVYLPNDLYDEVIKKCHLYHYTTAMIPMSGRLNKDIKLLNYIDKQYIPKHKSYEAFTYENRAKIEVLAIEKNMKTMSWISLGSGALMAVFAGVMIFNYFALTIADKRREIGILRALGARKIDVYNIFLSRGFAIALINALLGIILTVAGIFLIDFLLKAEFMIKVTVLSFGFVTFISIILISVITMLLGSIIPIKRIAGLPPAEAIKNL